ncbi:Eco57I restriction-modification methylase domain-containing protein [Candidatus Poriferisodalis sp.]|uniref:Eco57I restriction-modification methylase domain-containing protein n=1 Tax=Candidatus Poriferisodalis sp. TaxID=3101277 RepID=UPI003C6EB95E
MIEQELRQLLQQGDFGSLFRRMGWDDPGAIGTVQVEESDLEPTAVADKRGVTAWLVACPAGVPQRSEQHRVVRRLKRFSRDQLVVFVSPAQHLWLWPEQRSSGVGHRLVDHEYPSVAPTDALLQRLVQASFTLDEEDGLTATSVLARIRRSFNADKVTKSFYREFQKHHKEFVSEVEGISTVANRRWYVSVLLNRLMFIYFIQQKRFLDGDQNYLRNRLWSVREQFGEDRFYAFYREFLLPLFHEGLGSPSTDYSGIEAGNLIGDVPYVNGGIFEPHRLEKTHLIEVPDKAFESLFEFFEVWRWHLDERPMGESNEINPDILGFIFEQYINFNEAGQKENGAYYTKPDVTGYMASSTILPALADRFAGAGLEEPSVLLSGSDDSYIHDSVLHGVDDPLPEDWDNGDEEPSDSLSLPGERWCDIVHRRERCARLREILSDQGRSWSIDDAVTENLDLRELMVDYLSLLASADECDQAFEVLQSLTVCDPTVGSGAFLFAALEVLDPLYETVLGRAAELHGKDDADAMAECLAEARRHHSERYWMLKTLCLNNLYGVDLMDEAPEIAKLRLFLKLAAQIDDKSHIEPLPDLDFNIKVGNLLVGIKDQRDAELRLNAGQLDLGGKIAEIRLLTESVANAFESFTIAQSTDTGTSEHASAKQFLNAQLEAARKLADVLLHSKRSDATSVNFDDWKQSHQPFHWFVEFPSAWRSGGFDVVVGNPPYVAVAKITNYAWVGYRSQPCRNLYAPSLERASTLVKDAGRMSMVVMHSLSYNKDFGPLREFLSEHFSTTWVSSYSRMPDGLFSGSARVRNSILIGTRTIPRGLFTSSCRRWLTERRPHLFSTTEYVKPPDTMRILRGRSVWPFVDSNAVAIAFGKLMSTNDPLSASIVAASDHRLVYKKTAQYMMGVSDKPFPTSGADEHQNSGQFSFESPSQRDAALLILAGRWGYLWWLIYSDEFNVTDGVLAAFPGGLNRLLAKGSTDHAGFTAAQRIYDFASALKSEMPRHTAWKLNAGVRVGRYNMLECRAITDEADLFLAQAWGIEDTFGEAGNLRDRTIFGNKA